MSYIRLNNICLDYPITRTSNKSLKKTLFSAATRLVNKREKNADYTTYRAIDGLTIAIEENDRIGLLGRNGAGKSTLLRILSGIYHPTLGHINSRGSISSLLNMSIGLNAEATGYENIIILGILLGKTKQIMQTKFKEIEEFTELGSFLESPVRTYSNGMMLRLAFAVVTAIDPDILLLDEVIGVGDSSFMQKAQSRLHQLIHKSKILVISSHSLDIIDKFCNKVIVLDHGKCLHFGDVKTGIELYKKL